MRLVRHLTANPGDDIIHEEVSVLVESMFTSDIRLKVTNLMQHCVTTMPTTILENQGYVPESYTFESVQVFELLVRYWTVRIFLCGLIQTHFAISTPTALSFDLHAAQEHDIESAVNIAKALDYASTSCPSFPLIALRLLLPLQISFGAWHRLELRSLRKAREFSDTTGSIDSDLQYARAMKRWCMEVIGGIQDKWGPLRTSAYEDMEAKSEAFAGAPLEPWMKRQIKWTGGSAVAG